MFDLNISLLFMREIECDARCKVGDGNVNFVPEICKKNKNGKIRCMKNMWFLFYLCGCQVEYESGTSTNRACKF